MARMTIPIKTLVERANTMLATPDSTLRLAVCNRAAPRDAATPEEAFRMGVTALLESMLHEAGQYRGFAFTDGNAGDTDWTRRRYTEPR